ncbi:aspartic proteinase Asp1-like [Trifolium medium]|uniref:Aspartic proteinase Asp1-like n=1 Tax=Trifolium medium TaxID=97028 RepID=A0A392MUF2_9FABA|nr:aspartic proteinase Asp1-like [Trifolium medium]
MLIPPEGYLIVTKHGNVCLGILDGTEVGLGNLNIIGDISLQDKMVIYDNERQQIGWISSNCDRIPNIDRDFEGDAFQQPHAAHLGIFDDRCAADSEL